MGTKIMKKLICCVLLLGLVGCQSSNTKVEEKIEEEPVVEQQTDTLPPVFVKSTDEITIEAGETINYDDYFSAKDDSNFTLTYDDSKVDTTKAGTYVLKVSAEDEYKNKSELDVNVIVKDKPMDYTGYYFTNYKMNIRSDCSTSSPSVGWIKDGFQILVQETVTAQDGSIWAKLSTGYMCIQDKDNVYLRKNTDPNYEFLNPLDYADTFEYKKVACPAAQLGGLLTQDQYGGNINMTMGCNDNTVNLWIVY